MEVVLGQWDSWEDGSLLIDKKSGRFADPTKVKRLDHKGKFFKSRGPFTVPRSPQGHPVVIQAGASGRGQRFAGRWGEVIFHRGAQPWRPPSRVTMRSEPRPPKPAAIPTRCSSAIW